MANKFFIVTDGIRTAVENYKDIFPTLSLSASSTSCHVEIDSSSTFENCTINISCSEAFLKINKGNAFYAYFISMDVGNKQVIDIGADNTFFGVEGFV